MSKSVILTGLRANNDLQLGNYLGAILPMVNLQKQYGGEYQINMFVPDLHSFTTPIDHGRLFNQSMHNLKIFVASGLDLNDENTFLYRQSYISAHSELTVILNCFTYMGELSRMTQFKEKSENKSVSVGLFDYPVLMASDILLYGAKYVPVGEDQTQHVELARDIAIRINNKFGNIFTPPEPEKQQIEFIKQQRRLRVRDLLKPETKMSKSDMSGKGVIYLSDDPKAATKKIMSATTDSIGSINYDYDKQPGISNLLEILAALSGVGLDWVIAEYQGKSQYGELKRRVAEAVESFLIDFQSKLAKVDEAQLVTKLEKSEAVISATANETLLKVQKAVGLRV